MDSRVATREKGRAALNWVKAVGTYRTIKRRAEGIRRDVGEESGKGCHP